MSAKDNELDSSYSSDEQKNALHINGTPLINKELEVRKGTFSDLFKLAKRGDEIVRIAKQTAPMQWYAKGVVGNYGISVIYARAKRGKSLFAFKMTDSIAKGEDTSQYITNEYKKPLKTLYIDMELEEADMFKRYKDAFLSGIGFDVLFKDDIYTYNQDFTQTPDMLVKMLEDAYDDGYEFVVVDSISYAAVGLSDGRKAREYKMKLNQLTANIKKKSKESGRIPMSILFVAHMTKKTTNEEGLVDFDLMQGSSEMSQMYRNMTGMGMRKDLQEDEYGVYLKCESRDLPPELSNKCIPFIVSKDSNNCVDYIQDELVSEYELIKQRLVLDDVNLEKRRTILLAILKHSRRIPNAQEMTAEWTNGNQGHISRAKKKHEALYNEMIDTFKSSELELLKRWDEIKPLLDYGSSLPHHFENYILGLRKKSEVIAINGESPTIFSEAL